MKHNLAKTLKIKDSILEKINGCCHEPMIDVGDQFIKIYSITPEMREKIKNVCETLQKPMKLEGENVEIIVSFTNAKNDMMDHVTITWLSKSKESN